MTDAQRDEAEEAMLALAMPLEWKVGREGEFYFTEPRGRSYQVVKNKDTGLWHTFDPMMADPFDEDLVNSSADPDALEEDPFEERTYQSCAAAQRACNYHKVFGKWK